MTNGKITVILDTVSKRVQELIPSDRFYVALLDQGRSHIGFPLVRGGNIDSLLTAQRSLLERCLPDEIITRGESIIVTEDFPAWLKIKGIKYWFDINIPFSWLGVPLIAGNQAMGALIVESWRPTEFFNENHRRVLETVARQTSTAIENARLYEQLDRKISDLRILNQVGQKTMKGIAKQESEILDLLYQSATDLQLDTSNMYITFYDPDPQETDTPEAIHGRLRFALAYDDGNRISIPDRPAQNGLTELVIRTKQSFKPTDVRKAYQEIARDLLGKIPLSWLGVPMLAEGQVFGVITLRNNARENAYSEDDQEVLEILAGQAAISLLNLRYYEALQNEISQRIQVEKTAVMSNMAAEFAHKMNNIAGTIPIRVDLARRLLDPSISRDVKIMIQLDKIENEAKNLLDAAQKIRESVELGLVRVPENININDVVDIAIAKAKDTQTNTMNEVEIRRAYEANLPSISLDRTGIIDTLTSLIKNAFEAIPDHGTITVSTRFGTLEERPAIVVEVKDTGKGIPATELPKIFDLFYTTKGELGLGFGLWRDKVFLKNLGGDIDVLSEPGKGSTFIIKIPVEQNMAFTEPA